VKRERAGEEEREEKEREREREIALVSLVKLLVVSCRW